MRLRRMLRPAVAATALTAAVVAVPASAGPSHSNVGSASVYGLDKNFTLVGHTDLAKRGMNSPIAVAGRCVYVGDRYYSSSTTEKVRPNGGIAIVDVKNPSHPHQVGTIPPVELSTQREMRADAGLGILVVEGYSPYIDGYTDTAPNAINYLKIYDIHSDCRHPKLLEGPEEPGACAGLRDVHDLHAGPDDHRPVRPDQPAARRHLRPRRGPGGEDPGLRRRERLRLPCTRSTSAMTALAPTWRRGTTGSTSSTPRCSPARRRPASHTR
jgi:hypothetical protein